MKFRNASELKFYLYISNAKLEMLYGQFHNAAKLTRKMSASAKALGLSAQIESSTEEAFTQDEKLKSVIAELKTQGKVGSPANPNEYIQGTMRMRWGLFDDCRTRQENEPPLVFFGGVDKDIPLIVGLGGSTKHVVGHEGASSTYSRSCTPTLVKWLQEGLSCDRPPEIPLWFGKREEESEVFSSIACAIHYLRPPTQDLEFFA